MKILNKTAQFSLAGLTAISMLTAASYYLYYTYLAAHTDPLAAFATTNEQLEAKLLADGNAAYAKEDYATAMQLFSQLIERNPTVSAAQYNLGLSLSKLGKADLAIAQFEKVAELEPHNAHAYLQLGNLFQQQKQFAKANATFKKALELAPDNLNLAFTVATACAQQTTDEGYALALQEFQRLITQLPDDLSLLLQLGNLHITHGKLEQAQATYQELVALAPTSAAAKLALGQSYERQNKMQQAFKLYQEAVKLEPNNPAAHVALAGAHWVLGNTQQGFKEYEWRWQMSNMANTPLRWDGASPMGKTILLLAENGLGDIFQFIRFAKTLKKQGARIVARVNQSLIPLLSTCNYIDTVIAPTNQTTTFDALTSFQSLPALLNIPVKDYPKPPYLTADPKLVAHWKQQLAHDKKFKIGICWQSGGDIGHIPQGKRSIPLKLFAQLGDIKGISLYSLQKGDEALAQLHEADISTKVIDFGTQLDSNGAFTDTAAIMQVMDLIITIDTSVAHLAGALDVPTWTILPYHPDPRWMHERSDTFWYPNMRLFRQTKPGDWTSIIKQVKKELAQRIKQHKA